MLRPGAPAVVNIDDEWGSRLVSELPGKRVLTLSRENPDADGYIHSVSLSGSGTEFSLRTAGREIRIKSVLIGEHNVCNMSLAALAAYACGVPAELIAETLSAPDIAPPGRLEPFGLPNGARAFVDYAHTDDALFRVLTAIRAFCKGRIITVFGCGGDRDRTKRPLMGRTACQNSDLVFLTNDNPRTEDPKQIFADIQKGMDGFSNYEVEPDRRAAIFKAINAAHKDDIAARVLAFSLFAQRHLFGEAFDHAQKIGPRSDSAENFRRMLRSLLHILRRRLPDKIVSVEQIYACVFRTGEADQQQLRERLHQLAFFAYA